MMRVFEIVAAVVVTHYGACLIQMLLHARLGHDRRSGRMFREHLQNHHAIYSGFFAGERYIDEDQSLTAYYLIPIALCIGAAFSVFPLPIAAAVAIAFVGSLGLHVYLHIQYHLQGSFWRRFAWFRRRQRLHRLHHEYPNRNFGVVDFFWDRVLGTYSAEEGVPR